MPEPSAALDRIKLEVIRNGLTAAADEMALALQRAAYSTNIKTRLDFSCAIFDRQARMVAQSFSQPVHLGSLAHFVPRIIGEYGITQIIAPSKRIEPWLYLVFGGVAAKNQIQLPQLFCKLL